MKKKYKHLDDINFPSDIKNLSQSDLKILASSSDKIVESFCHNKHKLLGIMWHPERYKKLKKFDKNLFKKMFN